ncbi:MAG: 4Fe-4S dicluster domain-containing protein [Proteobacteria bacterium]|nr:4Fe-4S dicluster domain-containing protein [Pseudomonadota bacterium]MBU4469365.1 4Fe-4S dicluster domain-containing protein [Pseudomonadota bacterium]MCG2750478.1 4Fe-4S dicluster domain-containing protein [Desulfobacteraceae bacterium]
MKKPGIKGFRVETCFGGAKCPNHIHETEHLVDLMVKRFEAENLLGFLQEHIQEPIKYHHEFRMSVSNCPNACSRPQIKDIGIIGAILPKVADIPCNSCEACSVNCKENAIAINTEFKHPVIDLELCVRCGQCVKNCPTHTLAIGEKGFRVQVGGKLGRRPQLAKELPGLYNEEEVVSILSKCISFYKMQGENGERFGHIIARIGLDQIINPRF